MGKQSYSEISRKGWYNTTKWRMLRLLKLSQNPLCEHCEKNGILKRADLIDHIIPITPENTEKFYEYDNLQSLCDKCHRSKTRRDHGSRFSPEKQQQGRELKNKFENFD